MTSRRWNIQWCSGDSGGYTRDTEWRVEAGSEFTKTTAECSEDDDDDT